MARRNLPEEVITEILSWVPVKSLMRFKSVSKPWLHLISTDPNFIKLHFNRSFHTNNSNPGILVSRIDGVPKAELYYSEDYTTTSDELTRFVIPFSNIRYGGDMSYDYCCDYRVVNVCNGLVCLTDFYPGSDSKPYLWNPLTGDHITLPFSLTPSHFCFEDGDFRSGTNVMFGFGFNEDSDEYKIIRFVSTSAFETTDEFHSHVSVYTLGTDSSWRTIPYFVPYISRCSSPIAVVNGALHWIGFSQRQSDGMYSETLIAFHIQDESFQEISQPDGISSDHMLKRHVNVLGGLLSIFYSYQHEFIEIWVMDEYGVADSWRKVCKIEQLQVSGLLDYSKSLGVADNGEIIIRKNTWECISYDPNTNSVRDLQRFEFEVYDIQTFKGSLLSPTLINRASHMIP